MSLIPRAATRVQLQDFHNGSHPAVSRVESRRDTKLHHVLAEQIPRTGRLETVEAFNPETYALFRVYLEGHSDELRMVDLGLAAFVCVTSIEALTHTAVLHRSEMLSRRPESCAQRPRSEGS